LSPKIKEKENNVSCKKEKNKKRQSLAHLVSDS
jgi:hypothetical protein